jgi:hypothetical protein
VLVLNSIGDAVKELEHEVHDLKIKVENLKWIKTYFTRR